MAEDGLNESLQGTTSALAAIDRLVTKITGGLERAATASRRLTTNLNSANTRFSGGMGGGFGGGVTPTSNLGQGGGGNSLADGLGKFGGVMQGLGQVAQGIGQMGSGFATAMPNVQNTLQYSSSYYGASVGAGMGTGMAQRKMMQAATFGAISAGGGMTSVGADARVAGQLAAAGMNFSASANSTYMQTVNTASTLARYLNIPVEEAAKSVEGMTNAAGSSNMLRNYGIFTSDLGTGKEKTMPQIFEELRGRLQMRASTGERTQQSFRKGALGVVYNQLSAQYGGQTADLFKQYMVDSAAGKSTNWLDDKSLGTDNPLNSQYQLNASETKQMGKAEEQYIQGQKNAVPAVTALNDAFGDLAGTVGNLNAMFQTLSGAASVQGLTQIISGGFNTLMGVGNTAAAAGGVGGESRRSSSMNVFAGGTTRGSFAGIGGDSRSSTAVGATSTSSSQSFTSPVSGGKVSARLGQKGQYWDKEVGHRGTDFVAPQGTAVKSIGDGKVTSCPTGGELGNQVKITHSNGFVSHYCHLSTVSVKVGDTVTQGKQIGAAGNTGTNSHGAHLHFVLYDSSGSSVDPFNYITGLTDASGATSTTSSSGADGVSSTVGASSTTDVPVDTGSYAGVSDLISASSYGSISAGNNSTSAALGASSPAASKTPEAINGSTFGGSGSGYKTNAPSAKTGVDYVPQDSTYNLHQGEAVLTAEENAERRAGGRKSGTNVTINVTVQRASEDEARRMVTLMKDLISQDKTIAKIGGM